MCICLKNIHILLHAQVLSAPPMHQIDHILDVFHTLSVSYSRQAVNSVCETTTRP